MFKLLIYICACIGMYGNLFADENNTKVSNNWSNEEIFTETKADWKLKELLIEKYQGKNREYISHNIECSNPTQKINTLECLVVNLDKIILNKDNNIELVLPPRVTEKETKEGFEVKVIPLTEEERKYNFNLFIERFNKTKEFYFRSKIRVQTKKSTGERVIISSISGKDRNLWFDINVDFIILEDGLYQLEHVLISSM